MAVPHFAVELSLGNQRGHGVHYQDVDSAGSYKRFGDLQSLFAIVGLGDQQIVYVHPEFLRVPGIESVLRIHKGRHAAGFLSLGDHL